MPILAIGSKRIKTSYAPLLIIRAPVTVNAIHKSDAGFTLIEMLVAIAVMAVILAVAVLAIPNHDDRYWRDNLDQLVSSLNLAHHEQVACLGSLHKLLEYPELKCSYSDYYR